MQSANRFNKEVKEVEFGERKKKILSVIVEKYIEFGIPIGSKTVCSELDISVSSATVRNEMAELSELGYLGQPHTSAGRVPSYMGYKFYVHKLMKSADVSEEEKNFIDGDLCSAANDPEHLLIKASEVLAEITDLAAVFTTPQDNEARVRDIEFVKTGKRNAMLVLMTTSGMVQNRLFRCNYDITNELISAFKKVVNDKFKGKLLKDLNPGSMSILSSYGNDIFILMSPVFNALTEAAGEALEVQVKISGETNLITVSELSPIDILSILEFLRNKDKMLQVLMLREKGINIFIGDRELSPDLGAFSIITSRYNVGGRLGGIGVIGPNRIDYKRVVSKIRYVASAVEMWLRKILEIDI